MDKVDLDSMRIKICEQEMTVYDDEELAILENLRSDRAEGIPVSKATYREAMDMLVAEIDPTLLGPAAGIVCGIAYVRNSLPNQARLYVKRHEFEHLLQDPLMENSEMAANVVAAKEYPIGLVQTITYALWEGKKELTWCCFLVGGWAIFKSYFLGIGSL
ncbi:MAG: hypothetical protein M5U34_26710 [Chloroflexi bacterium]|nr:hypothetical protein [Chloroflexota bacterium]